MFEMWTEYEIAFQLEDNLNDTDVDNRLIY